jgi:hypothetical protein
MIWYQDSEVPEMTIRKQIIKMFFWALMIADDTRRYQLYVTKLCYILQNIKLHGYLNILGNTYIILSHTYHLLDNNEWYYVPLNKKKFRKETNNAFIKLAPGTNPKRKFWSKFLHSSL